MPLDCVLEKTLESPLDSKKVKPVNPKGNQTWIFIIRTDAKAEAPVLWPSDGRAHSLEMTLIWERLRGGGEGDDRGWDGWMASLTRWTWIWANWNVNPLQCSCLENPRDGGAWSAAVYGVAKSWTWLKQLSSSSQEIVDRQAWHAAVHRVTKSWTHLSDWTTSISYIIYYFSSRKW